MATPFDTAPQAEVKLATEAQLIRAIQPMLDDRNWQIAPDAYATRCAAIKTVLSLLTNGTRPTALGVPLTGVLADDFAAVMAECAKVAEPGMERVWKPLTRDGASALIDWLGQQAWAGNTSLVEEANVVKATAAAVEARTERVANGMPSAEVVPAGRYAIETVSADAINELAFYKVDRPTEGKWAGYVFVRHIVGDDERNVPFAQTKGILARIAEDAKGAAIRYGHEIGECGRCGRQLTNDESRAYGIGPDCRAKLGW